LHYIISAVDSSGNWNNTGTKDVSILDNDAPEIMNVAAYPNPQHVGFYVNISCEVFDNIGVNIVKVNISYPDGYMVNLTMSGGSYYYNATYTMLGTYHYFIWAKDVSGNSNSSPLHQFEIVENIPPVADFKYSPLHPTTKDTIQFTDLSTDADGSVVNWTWTFGDGNISYTQNPAHSYADDGIYNVTLTVRDNDGAIDSTYHIIAVSSIIPPTADFSYSPLNPTDLDTITFIDTSTDSDGSVVNWTWNFGDGNISYTQNPAHSYADDGIYNVTLTVRDNDGAIDNITKQITVSNVPPTADFTYSRNKLFITFTDASIDPDGVIVNWTWDFGDGHISYEQNPKHNYVRSAGYTVTLATIDNDGATASISKKIMLDTTPPSTYLWVNGTLGENEWYISDYVVIGFMANDIGSGVAYTMYKLEDRGWHNYDSAMAIWQNGEHVIEYYSVDYNGNRENTKSYSFKIDNKPPEIEVLYPNGGEILNGIVTIKWNASDNCDDNLSISIAYSDDGGITWHIITTNELNDGEYEWDTAGLKDGENYLIRISTTDDAGNNGSDTSNITFTIQQPTIPPYVTIVKPRGSLYIGNREVIPLLGNTTIILGAITVEIYAESKTGIESVEIYVDEELKYADIEAPYEWLWDETIFGKHTVKAVAYDNAGNMASDEQHVWILNI